MLSDHTMPSGGGPLAATTTGKLYWWGALGDGDQAGAQREIVLEPLYPRNPSETGFRPSDRLPLPPGTHADAEFLHALDRRYQGIPAEIMAHPDLLELLLPPLRKISPLVSSSSSGTP